MTQIYVALLENPRSHNVSYTWSTLLYATIIGESKAFLIHIMPAYLEVLERSAVA